MTFRLTSVRAMPVAVALGMAACGSVGDSAPPTRSQVSAEVSSVPDVMLSVALRDTGCELDGAGEVPAGPVVIGLRNGTDGRFDLDLWRLAEGHEYDELASHIEEEMRRMEAEENPLGHPAFADLVGKATAERESDGELRADLGPGTYGFACISFITPEAPSAMWAAGPLEVSLGLP